MLFLFKYIVIAQSCWYNFKGALNKYNIYHLRLKKINAMSQSSWQIGKPDLNAVFFNVFFFFFSEQQTCEIWVGHNFEIWNLILLDFAWTRYKAEHKSWRSLLFKVFHCVCHIFSCIFWQASHKKLEKKIKQAKKKSNLEFCWIKRAPKNKCAQQLWDIGFIFFSLISNSIEDFKLNLYRDFANVFSFYGVFCEQHHLQSVP